jgi:hypothetical protein
MNKITKNDLLKLKDSKAVPITAHSHEVIVPVVFASKVNKFLEKEGIKLPLTHHQLAEYKKKAAKLKGKYEEDIKECDEGNSHAKGTHNVKVSNVKGSVYINTHLIKAKKRKGKKGRIITRASGLIQPPDTSMLKNRIKPPPSNTLRPNYNAFATIRPQGITYSANTPTLQDIQKELQIESNKQKEAVDKQVEKLEKEGKERKKHIDDLERALEKEQRNEGRLIHNETRLNTPDTAAAAAASSSSSSSSGLHEEEEEAAMTEVGNIPPGRLKLLCETFGVHITSGGKKKTSQQLYSDLNAKNPAIIPTFLDAFASFSKAGAEPSDATRKAKILAKMKELNPSLFD